MAHSGAESIDALLLHGILRTHNALTPYIDRGLRELPLTGAKFNALLLLREAGPEGLPLGELGQRLVVSKSNVTGLVDRLERDGLVTRQGHGDRRVTLARLTARGASLLEEALPRHRRILAELLGCLTTAEKEQLVGLLSKLRRGVRERGDEGDAL